MALLGENRELTQVEAGKSGSREDGRPERRTRRCLSLTGFTGIASLIWSILFPFYIVTWILFGVMAASVVHKRSVEESQEGVRGRVVGAIILGVIAFIVNIMVNVFVTFLTYSKAEPSPRTRTLYFTGWILVTVGDAMGIAVLSYIITIIQPLEKFLDFVLLYVGVPLAIFVVLMVLSIVAAFRVRTRCSCHVPQRY